MNNKGFTLIELLAVITLIGILGCIGAGTITNQMSSVKTKNDNILKGNIKKTFEMYLDECSIDKTETMCTNKYDSTNKQYKVTLDYLSKIGYLKATNGKITNSNNDDISSCEYILKRSVDANYVVSYTYTLVGTDSKCPIYS